MRKTYDTPQIHCHSCAALIRETLEEVPGLGPVEVAVASKRVTVDYGEAPAAELKVLELLEEIGYRPVSA